MFSEIYEELDRQVRKILDEKNHKEEIINPILQKSLEERLSMEEIGTLLKITNPKIKIEVIEFIKERFTEEKNIIKNISPIYLSSFCTDACKYCNFNKNKKHLRRTRLSEEETKEEVLANTKQGKTVIEFTLATDPVFTPNKISKYINETKNILEQTNKKNKIMLCSDYFTEKDYKLLKDTGLWGVVQWDETLDKKQYIKWHKGSQRKENFSERINTHDKAIKQGMEAATGILFGLSDYKYDVMIQIMKARYLEKEYGKQLFTFGTPRLKKIEKTNLKSPFSVTDLDFAFAIAIYKIAEPQISRWLQTRETIEFNFQQMLNNDYITYNCGDVKPGGYWVNKENKYSSQFRVNELTEDEIKRKLEKQNFKLLKSW